MDLIRILAACTIVFSLADCNNVHEQPFSEADFRAAASQGQHALAQYASGLSQSGKGDFIGQYFPDRCFSIPIVTFLKFETMGKLTLKVMNTPEGPISGTWQVLERGALILALPEAGIPEDASGLSGRTEWILQTAAVHDGGIQPRLYFAMQTPGVSDNGLLISETGCPF